MVFKTIYDAMKLQNLKLGKHEIRGTGGKTEHKGTLIESSIEKDGEDGVYLHVKGISDDEKARLNAYIIENGKNEEEKEKEKEEIGGSKGEKKKAKILLIIPVVVLLGLGSCSHTDQKVVEVTQNKQIILYNTENPGIIEEGISGIAGQEEMTNGGYDWKNQAERESNATTDYEKSKLLEQQVDECYNILYDEQKTQEEKIEAIKKLNSTYAQQEAIFMDGQERIEQFGEDANVALTSKPDERTESEVRIVDNQISNYNKSKTLTGENVKATGEIVDSPNEIRDIEFEREKDGDGKIKYKEVKQLVEQQSHRGISAVVHNISDYIHNMVNKIKSNVTKTKETNERSKQEENKDGEDRSI